MFCRLHTESSRVVLHGFGAKRVGIAIRLRDKLRCTPARGDDIRSRVRNGDMSVLSSALLGGFHRGAISRPANVGVVSETEAFVLGCIVFDRGYVAIQKHRQWRIG